MFYSLQDYKHQLEENKRTLIIIPGYSVSNPPRIGHHLYYIKALKYDPIKNPYGYKRIYLFDLYSKKDGRCNFKHTIPELADEVMKSIESERDGWIFEKDGEIDFIGASMGGLIVRKVIQNFLTENDSISTLKWGDLKVKNILLIATPNKGCKIVDRIQNPFVQFLLRIFYGKNNFSKSIQFNQISAGNELVFSPVLNKLFKKRTEENTFIKELNKEKATLGNIRWLTIRGTKSQLYSRLFFNKKIKNDGVVESDTAMLNGAENICDKDININDLWNHRDLYMANSVCELMFGLLVLQLKLADYLLLKQLKEFREYIYNNSISFGLSGNYHIPIPDQLKISEM